MAHTSNISTRAVAAMLLLCAGCAVLFGQIALRAAEVQIEREAAYTDTEIGNRSCYTIVIDAGQGGEDGGTQSASGLYEKTVNLEIAQMLTAMLDGCGVETVMTRQEDILLYDRNADYHGHKKMLDLATRKKIAEETENALFVSIHMNAFPEKQYKGLQVFYSVNDSTSYTVASGIQERARMWLDPGNTRKVKAATSAIYLLDRLKCPAVLVECGFLSNPEEAARFETTEYRQKVAFTIFCALMVQISEQGA